jgi:hypothetical protein
LPLKPAAITAGREMIIHAPIVIVPADSHPYLLRSTSSLTKLLYRRRHNDHKVMMPGGPARQRRAHRPAEMSVGTTKLT